MRRKSSFSEKNCDLNKIPLKRKKSRFAVFVYTTAQYGQNLVIIPPYGYKTTTAIIIIVAIIITK